MRFLNVRLLVLPALASLVLPVRADILYADQFKNIEFTQTGNSSTTFQQSFFSSSLYETGAGDYSSVTLTCTHGTACGGQTLTQQVSPDNEFLYQTPGLPSTHDMNQMFRQGTYTLTTNTGATTSYSYTANDYSHTPRVTDYSSLQDSDSADNLVFDLNAFGKTGDATDSYIFFTIYDETSGTYVFTDNFLPDTTTKIVVPGDTLSPGDTFEYQLDYSNRVLVAETNSVFDAQLGFDKRTDGIFTTTVPEPASFILLATVLLGIGFVCRRRFVLAR
ncbi:MAG TPA: PEP-CTERM sorting domain-containing protein [Bryobacteraceae bacterium]|nr:PEP-CTERM sorting domain-containing protein [Bryobacteraceae bacterium]